MIQKFYKDFLFKKQKPKSDSKSLIINQHEMNKN